MAHAVSRTLFIRPHAPHARRATSLLLDAIGRAAYTATGTRPGGEKVTKDGTRLKRIVAADLFCGAGGLTRGLLDAGIEVVAGYDVDKACRYPYEHNNHPAVFKRKSVASVTGRELATLYPPNCWRVLVGCAPCTPFSKYTQGATASEHDKWGLLYEFGRSKRGYNRRDMTGLPREYGVRRLVTT